MHTDDTDGVRIGDLITGGDSRLNDLMKQHDEALLHASKELGVAGLAKAAERMGNIEVVVAAALKQLKAIPEAKHRDASGLIVVGLLDLTQLGLTAEEAAARRAELGLPAHAGHGEHGHGHHDGKLVGGHKPTGSYTGLAAQRPTGPRQHGN